MCSAPVILIAKILLKDFKDYFVFTLPDKVFVKASLRPGNGHCQAQLRTREMAQVVRMVAC